MSLRRLAPVVRSMPALWRAIPRGERAATVVVCVVFAAAEVSLRLLAIESALRLAGARVVLVPVPMGSTQPRALHARERRRLRAVQRIARHWPFGRGPCLREAFATAVALPGRNVTVRFGVSKDGGSLDAHAWVEVEGHEVGSSAGYEPFGEPGRSQVSAPSPDVPGHATDAGVVA